MRRNFKKILLNLEFSFKIIVYTIIILFQFIESVEAVTKGEVLKAIIMKRCDISGLGCRN